MGTVLVSDIRVGSGSSNPQQLTNHNGTLFFTANDGATGVELWKSNGTAASTVLVKDLNTAGASSIGNLTSIVQLYFCRYRRNAGQGVVQIRWNGGRHHPASDIFVGPSSSNPQNFVTVGSVAYFAADNGNNGRELWRSDGTAGGTQLISDINFGAASSIPHNMLNANGTLYFAATIAGGTELFRSNGTSFGTIPLSPISAAGTTTAELFPFNDSILFSASNAALGAELWISDGTVSGTKPLKDIYPGTESSFPSGFTLINGKVYFSAVDPVHGRELWKTDGTPEGTELVRDIVPGLLDSSPFN